MRLRPPDFGILRIMAARLSIYIHIPFCRHRCAYCDFNTYAGLEVLIPAYTKAVCNEICLLGDSEASNMQVGTVFFGGGTPSLLPSKEMEIIVKALERSFDLAADAEISLEANPGTVDQVYLKSLHALGFNRISFGMQSANPNELIFLERQHSYRDIENAVNWSRAAGFQNLNLDLIFGLPEQPLNAWQESVSRALALGPEHLSLYALTIEHGTPLRAWVQRGMVSQPDPDNAAEMYEWAAATIEAAGFGHYEISNWARLTQDEDDFACRHNLQYWRMEPYLGIGAGAHSYFRGVRVANVSSPRHYIERFLSAHPYPAESSEENLIRTPATQSVRRLSQVDEMGELMMMGLRLVREGVSDEGFSNRFGVSLNEKYGEEIKELIAYGLLEWKVSGGGAYPPGRRLRLTRRGYLLANQVFVRFI